MDNIYELRERHRSEWENMVISLIGCGVGKYEAQQRADISIRDRYDTDEDDDEAHCFED